MAFAKCFCCIGVVVLAVVLVILELFDKGKTHYKIIKAWLSKEFNHHIFNN
ncbi:MAG: hypothetical protein ACTHJ2_07435 [Candidatus Nitrosocosmicus sp.]